MVNQFLAELFGTALLILLGDGVVANIALKKTKGNSADLIVVTVGWAIAVAIPVYIFSRVSGAVFNPAVTIALGITGGLAWNQVVVFCIAQFIGAFIGAVLVYLTYYTHFESTEDHDAKLGTFCTTPAIRNLIRENKTYQIQNIIQTSSKIGMQSMDQELVNLFRQGKIYKESVLSRCTDFEYTSRLVGGMNY